MKRAIIFDMDGVLVDSNRVHWQAYQRTFLPLGREFDWDEYNRIGVGASREIVIRRALGELPDAELTELMATKERHVLAILDADGVAPIDGAPEFVATARRRGLATGVSTSSRTPEPFLSAAGLVESFDAIVGRCDVERPKPAPDGYLVAARTLGVEPADCLAIEDSGDGVQAAIAAGMDVIALTTTKPRASLTDATAVCDSFDAIDLDEWVRR